jgi:hypothetical protein
LFPTRLPTDGSSPLPLLAIIFSTMDPYTPTQVQSQHSHQPAESNAKESVDAFRISPRQLDQQLSAASDTEEDTMEGYSESSLSDISFDDELFNTRYYSDTEVAQDHKYKDSATVEESEKLWALFFSSKEDWPLRNVSKDVENTSPSQYHTPSAEQSTNGQYLIRSFGYDIDTHDNSNPFHQSGLPNSPISLNQPHTYSKSQSYPKKSLPSVLPPLTPPDDGIRPKHSHPQHKSWPLEGCSKVVRPSNRSHAHTMPSRSRGLSPAKCNLEAIHTYPPRSSSMATGNSDIYVRSAPSSPSFLLPTSDFMEKMQKSVFEWDSEDEDGERLDLPEWIRKLAPRRAHPHKDQLAKATCDFKKKTKTKSKSFGALGEAFKKSLKIWKN